MLIVLCQKPPRRPPELLDLICNRMIRFATNGDVPYLRLRSLALGEKVGSFPFRSREPHAEQWSIGPRCHSSDSGPGPARVRRTAMSHGRCIGEDAVEVVSIRGDEYRKHVRSFGLGRRSPDRRRAELPSVSRHDQAQVTHNAEMLVHNADGLAGRGDDRGGEYMRRFVHPNRMKLRRTSRRGGVNEFLILNPCQMHLAILDGKIWLALWPRALLYDHLLPGSPAVS